MFVFMIIKNIYNYKILLVLAYNYKPSHNNVFWFWHIEYKLLLNNKIVTINEYSIHYCTNENNRSMTFKFGTILFQIWAKIIRHIANTIRR